MVENDCGGMGMFVLVIVVCIYWSGVFECLIPRRFLLGAE